MYLHLKDELLGGKVNTACPGHRVVMGAGASKTFFNTRNNCFFLIQMAGCVKGIAEQDVVFFFLLRRDLGLLVFLWNVTQFHVI